MRPPASKRQKEPIVPALRAYCHPDNFKGASNVLLHQKSDGTFEDVTTTAQIADPAGKGLGVAFADFDNDGLRDLFVAQGHVLDTVEKSTAYLKYEQPLLLMRNTGKGFVNVSATAGGPFKNPIAARGAAFGDLNNDGQLDIVVGVLDSGPLVLRNNGTRNHWLGVLLTGSQSNRQGLGARVTVADNSGKKQFFEVTTAGSYIAAQGVTEITALAHFGQTPQAFANCSPGLEHSDNPGIRLPILFNPERVRLHKPFSGFRPSFCVDSQGCRCAPTLGCN